MSKPHHNKDRMPEVKYRFNDPAGREKLGEAILYISDKCQGDEEFCSTFLNKVLWYADLLSYAQTGKPITGLEYHKIQHGPAPVLLMPVRNELESQHALVLQMRKYRGMDQKRTVALRPARLDKFSGSDVEFINIAIETLRGQTATRISEWSHQRAWKNARDRELIPYNAVWLSEEPITQDDIREAKELIAVHGWAGV